MFDVISFITNNQIGEYKEKVECASLSTFKVGGTSPLLIYPRSLDKLIQLLVYLKETKKPHKVIGFGSNIVFNDGDIQLILIRLDALNDITIDGTTIKVGAGYSLWKLALQLSKMGLSGLEFATGIPGTVGGAIYMNAGAYKADMKGVVKEIKVIDQDLHLITLKNEELNYGYRSSLLQRKKDYICVEATLECNHGDTDSIMALVLDRKERRLASQPLEYPNAGSVFRNPENDFAGRLIEEAGLKGMKIGGAEVSSKHANFIINSGNATGNDIHELIYYVKDKIKEVYGIDLIIEQEFVGWDDYGNKKDKTS